MSIAKRIEDRKLAQEYIEMMGEQSLRFWEVIFDHAKARLGVIPEDVAMTEDEAKVFEQTRMSQGKFMGQLVHEVPTDYLLFMAGESFNTRHIKRYVKSERFQRRQENDG